MIHLQYLLFENALVLCREHLVPCGCQFGDGGAVCDDIGGAALVLGGYLPGRLLRGPDLLLCPEILPVCGPGVYPGLEIFLHYPFAGTGEGVLCVAQRGLRPADILPDGQAGEDGDVKAEGDI